MLNVVVFPRSLGPSKPTISPAPTVMETPFTTRRWPYSFTSFSVCSRGLSTVMPPAGSGGNDAVVGSVGISLMSR